jgi:hypothetical protein
MSEDSWQKWAQSLQHNHLKGLALTLLDGAGPFKIVLSQVMLSTAPFLGGNRRIEWQAFAEMLESETESRKFAEALREEKKHEQS